MASDYDERGKRVDELTGDTTRDERVEQLKGRLVDATADVAATVQRLSKLADDRGLGVPDLSGTGDLIYDVLTDQMLLAERVIRHQHTVLERLAEKALEKATCPSESVVVEGDSGKRAVSKRFQVRNPMLRKGTLVDVVEGTFVGPKGTKHEISLTVESGKTVLDTGESTFVRLALPPGPDLPVGQYAARLPLQMTVAGTERPRLLAMMDVEIWLESSEGA